MGNEKTIKIFSSILAIYIIGNLSLNTYKIRFNFAKSWGSGTKRIMDACVYGQI